jgi:hypothetical protein
MLQIVPDCMTLFVEGRSRGYSVLLLESFDSIQLAPHWFLQKNMAKAGNVSQRDTCSLMLQLAACLPLLEA